VWESELLIGEVLSRCGLNSVACTHICGTHTHLLPQRQVEKSSPERSTKQTLDVTRHRCNDRHEAAASAVSQTRVLARPRAGWERGRCRRRSSVRACLPVQRVVLCYVLEFDVCRVRFARVSCPRLRFQVPYLGAEMLLARSRRVPPRRVAGRPAGTPAPLHPTQAKRRPAPDRRRHLPRTPRSCKNPIKLQAKAAAPAAPAAPRAARDPRGRRTRPMDPPRSARRTLSPEERASPNAKSQTSNRDV
jgi:hypothetical protein